MSDRRRKRSQVNTHKEDTIYEDEVDIESVESVLKRMKKMDNTPLLNDRQIYDLVSLTFDEEGDLPLFSLDNRSQLYEIIGHFIKNPSLINSEIENMKNLLMKEKNKTFVAEDILFSINIFEKEKRQFAIEEDASRETVILQEGIGVYTCGKCGSDRTVYTEKQLSRSDEPMSVIVKCQNCGHGWRIG